MSTSYMQSGPLRAEDISDDDILNFFAGGAGEDQIISRLMGPEPILVRGSRGMGKSFLMRVAAQKLRGSTSGPSSKSVIPIQLTFAPVSVEGKDLNENEFVEWMTNQIGRAIYRTVRRSGIYGSSVDRFEGAHASDLIEYVEDIIDLTGTSRIVLFVDEAVHVFSPVRQALFFSLMRTLRTPFISVNAAVYPGVTNFGNEFEPGQDGAVLDLTKDVSDSEYLDWCRSILEKQLPTYEKAWAKKVDGSDFALLAVAAAGNPRSLLRMAAAGGKNVQAAVSEEYALLSSNHADLARRYPGREDIISWGHEFFEKQIVRQLAETNTNALANKADAGKRARVYVWVSRKAPSSVQFALDILCYSGLLVEHQRGVSTRQGAGTRYLVNGSALIESLNNISLKKGLVEIVLDGVQAKRWKEFQASSPSFSGVPAIDISDEALNRPDVDAFMQMEIGQLPLSEFYKGALRDLGYRTIREAYDADVSDFKRAKWIGDVRAEVIYTIIRASIFEFVV